MGPGRCISVDLASKYSDYLSRSVHMLNICHVFRDVPYLRSSVLTKVLTAARLPLVRDTFHSSAHTGFFALSVCFLPNHINTRAPEVTSIPLIRYLPVIKPPPFFEDVVLYSPLDSFTTLLIRNLTHHVYRPVFIYFNFSD